MSIDFIPGLELSRRLYEEVVRPILDAECSGLIHSAARVGSGSEVLGFDNERSADHEWGPRFQVFLPDDSAAAQRAEISALLANRLPKEFLGFPTHFHSPDGGPIGHMTLTDGPVNHRIGVTTLEAWYQQELGFDPQVGVSTLDWISAPKQRLAENTAGAVFHDGLGTLEATRSTLSWYPDDIWRYSLACQWQRISQQEAFVGRAGEVGDELGSSIVASRLVNDVMHLSFLLERQWAPYNKWLGSAFQRLAIAPALHYDLVAALSASTWQEREAPLSRCYEIVANAQNALGLTEPVDPGMRSYHGRPFMVIHGERFASVLHGSISDEQLRGVPLTGTIDQFVDNTDVLTQPAKTRALMTALLAGEYRASGRRIGYDRG